MDLRKEKISNEKYALLEKAKNDGSLSKNSYHVLTYMIKEHMRGKDCISCFPTIKTISSNLKVSTRTVQRAINELIKKSYLEKESMYSKDKNGGQTSNFYSLIIFVDGEKQIVNNPKLDKFVMSGKRISCNSNKYRHILHHDDKNLVCSQNIDFIKKELNLDDFKEVILPIGITTDELGNKQLDFKVINKVNIKDKVKCIFNFFKPKTTKNKHLS